MLQIVLAGDQPGHPVFAEPLAEYIHQPLPQGVCPEDPAVEQQVSRLDRPARFAVRRQERRDMTRDPRVRFERQADLPKAGRPPRRRLVVQAATRKEPVGQQVEDRTAVHGDRHGSADQPAASPQHRNRVLRRPSAASRVSLAVRHECHRATDCQGSKCMSLLLEQGGNLVRQGQVHVVPAHQQMVAHGDSPEHEFALVLRDGRPRVKSVVPPPTSQTSRRSPTPSSFRHRSPRSTSQA